MSDKESVTQHAAATREETTAASAERQAQAQTMEAIAQRLKSIVA